MKGSVPEVSNSSTCFLKPRFC